METFKYRFLWTWDGWICRRNRESFLFNYKKLVDAMSTCGLNGLIVWGLLDDAHGGVKAAVELCEYAGRKGVRILPGVGIFSYGGIYCRGNHPYNLETYVKKHPAESAVFSRDDMFGSPFDVPLPRGVPRGILCPSRKENLAWTEQGVEWLCRNVPIGGVNFETGDNGLCACNLCVRRRGGKKKDGFSFADMEFLLPHFSKLVHSLSPDLWITSGIYTDYWSPPVSELRRLNALPRYAVTNWNVAAMEQEYAPTKRIKKLFSHQNVGYARYNGSTHFRELYNPIYPYYSCWGFYPFIASARKFCRTARKEELDGVCFTGSGLTASPDNEINYPAFSYFAGSPGNTVDDFGKDVLGPLYGKDTVPLLVNGLMKLETINRQLRYYLLWIFPLLGEPAGSRVGKVWGTLEKVDPRAGTFKEDWKNCAGIIRKSIFLLQQAERNAHADGRRRLGRIVALLTQEKFLFEKFFPACLPVFRGYERLMKRDHRTVQENRRHYGKITALAGLIRSSPLDVKIFSPEKMPDKYRRAFE